MFNITHTIGVVFACIGGGGILVVLGLIIYWVVTSAKDPVTENTFKIVSKLDNLNTTIGNLIKEIRADREARKRDDNIKPKTSA